jgi:alkanesulfonate monooxygenase SsuD/methylene tetrahydromethanopterin reductase-like flavin-dependent oxidoreductase (luciferase family)
MIRLIKRLWTEQTITSTGSRYPLQDFTLEPRPIQQPRPPIWIGGWGELALKRAAWLGDAWLPGPTANMEKLKAAKHTYQAHLLQSGIDPAERTQPLTRDLVIAPTANEAEEIALKFLLPAYRDEYSRWSHPLIGSSDSTAVDRLAELRQDRFIIGDPEGVRAGVQHFITEFGTDHLIFRLHFPHMPVELVTRAVKLLGEEIIPAFA